ncbi:23S rRNA m(5)U-1939 methyltransferase [Arboricoccus pini]|uniref:23S rRNA m(5)U-1939 methyltransferase n=1 Tax=Arboricoccus pini TaxID=1963835 RepID=A0A212QUZ8_9PROT|nr:TRAM domain-containing protein [Arboricoccus pini]SNB63346.1 23S rRNA m(5)U-1939 methyltransferase [Arboricoccus pini]
MKGGRGKRGRAAAATREATLTIERLGTGGDGIAHLEGRPVFVPFTLPGETWRVVLQEGGAWRGRPLERLGEPVARAEPSCPHFTRCGGCLLQHLPDPLYDEFKRQRVIEPLRQARIDHSVPALLARSPQASRRRVRLAYARRGGRLLLGYRALRSHDIVPIATCPISLPVIQDLLPPLTGLLTSLGGEIREGEVVVTATHTGLDVRLGGVEARSLEQRERLAAFADTWDLARLTVASERGAAEAIVTRRPPVLRFGTTLVTLPLASFLQATEAGEAALQAAVADWLPDRTRVVDLYAGLGTLTLPIATRCERLDLVEGDADASAACARAIAAYPRLQARCRDLEADPLEAAELAPFDAAVLDPPRSGAARQVERLAKASLDRIVYVSCHPGSFARDAQHLQAAGFELVALRPVDQFLFAPEVELAALFLRGQAKAKLNA